MFQYFALAKKNYPKAKRLFTIKNYYYRKLIENGIFNYSLVEYEADIRNAACYFPFFVAVWFGTTPQDELIDKNFPFFFITKMFLFLDEVLNYSA